MESETEKTEAGAAAVGLVDVGVNEVFLRGRVSAEPVARELPSGDLVLTLRVVVPRTLAAAGTVRTTAARRAPTVDTLDCAVWSARLRRTVAGWRAGDIVEVQGAVRRRFYRAGGAAVSRVEIEVTRGRVIRRSDSASGPRGSASAGTRSPSPAAAGP